MHSLSFNAYDPEGFHDELFEAPGQARPGARLLNNELHAWSEVYLPGGGWRGFDPTHDLAVADHHSVLTAAIKPRDAAPVTGSFRGTGAHSEMEYCVQFHPKN